MYTIQLAKEFFKFSCSHFTILGPEQAERLHGHNYQMRVQIKVDEVDPKLGLAFDFNKVKPLIRKLCDELDERILIPTRSPYLKVKTENGQIEIRFQNKRYEFPAVDTFALPLINISSEELARYAAENLAQQMHDLPYWSALKVNIEETRGQSVSYALKR